MSRVEEMELSIGLGVVILIFFIAYIYLYISSRQYLKQGFTNATTEVTAQAPWWDIRRYFWANKGKDVATPVAASVAGPVAGDASGNTVPGVTIEKEVVRPYTDSKIMGVDDYEYSLIFQNEADSEISTAVRNKLMSQYPMDWSSHPPSSSQFQQGVREMFENASAQASAQASAHGASPDAAPNPYTAISEDSLTPPDTLKQEQEERNIIQSYQPKHADDLTTYNIDDAMELINKIYAKRGEIPQVVHKGNVYEVIGTRKKGEKIVYEETDTDAAASTDPVAEVGENTLTVPQAAADAAASTSAVDPFFESGTKGSQGRWNYRQWTPGLERMFAPTEAKAQWY